MCSSDLVNDEGRVIACRLQRARLVPCGIIRCCRWLDSWDINNPRVHKLHDKIGETWAGKEYLYV